jgi:16S rRNA (cytidine1402-2'-O)-methyltransferase
MGSLYLVATPIGNLKDISLRALEVLQQVGLIAAEDTRTTGVLLSHYNIHTPLRSYHEYNKDGETDRLVELLASQDIAIVSDAGSPGLNDPGYELVCRAIASGYPVIPVPGPSSPIAALTASGLPTDKFLYLGYLPRKHTERVKLLQSVADLPYTLIVLETPHRLTDALVDLRQALGNRRLVLGREMTKKFEEFTRIQLEEADTYFLTHEPRGEYTLVIEGHADRMDAIWEQGVLETTLRNRMREPYQARELAKEMAAVSGWNSKDIYDLIHSFRKG